MIKQYLNSIQTFLLFNIVQILVFITVGESVFSNTVCIFVPNTVLILFGNFENTVFLLLPNFVILGLLFCILFKYCFMIVRMGSKVIVFCLREFEPIFDCLQHVLSRV